MERKAKSANDQRAVANGCLLLVVMMLLYLGPFLLSEVVIALNPPPVLLLIWIHLFWLIFPSVGIYVGYRTQSPGWLTGALPTIVMGVLVVLSTWCVTKLVDWITMLVYAVAVVLGMLGGWIGQRLRRRRLSETHNQRSN